MSRARQIAWKPGWFSVEAGYWRLGSLGGSTWGAWGIVYRGRYNGSRRFDVFHLPTGQRVAQFDSLLTACFRA